MDTIPIFFFKKKKKKKFFSKKKNGRLDGRQKNTRYALDHNGLFNDNNEY